MTDYSKMSDFEINAAVATAQFGNWRADADICQRITSKRIDYCNNPSDAWPIISKNRISIMFDGTSPEYEGEYNEWCDAISSCQRFGVQHQSNSLRAAMIVFLMMKDAEKC